MDRDSTLDNVQPSLRDCIMFHSVPRTASWAKFSQLSKLAEESTF